MLDGTASKADAGHELQRLLEKMMQRLLGDHMGEVRWIDAEFPFTGPSWEMEVMYRGKWLEVLGCGVVQPQVLANANPALAQRSAWAFGTLLLLSSVPGCFLLLLCSFSCSLASRTTLYRIFAACVHLFTVCRFSPRRCAGLGLERLAMLLFNIPDIRLFWSQDPRFTSQFAAGQVAHFKPYSSVPACYKDIAFWVPSDFHYNNLCEVRALLFVLLNISASRSNKNCFFTSPVLLFTQVVRGIAGDLVESVDPIDRFAHPKTGRESHCYRIQYCAWDRVLTNAEIDVRCRSVCDRQRASS